MQMINQVIGFVGRSFWAGVAGRPNAVCLTASPSAPSDRTRLRAVLVNPNSLTSQSILLTPEGVANSTARG